MEHDRRIERKDRVIRALRMALPAYVASRLLLWGAAVILLVIPTQNDVEISSAFTTWDSKWYTSIAEHGYLPGSDVDRPSPPLGADTSVDGAVAYFPLYPLIVAGLGALLPFSLDIVAVAVSLVLGGAAAVTFAKLAAELTSEDAAQRAVLLFCFFPGAYILSLAYPEGLLILLGCFCLLQLQREAWLLAGIAAGLASATRPNGLALTVSCAVAAFIAIRRKRDRNSLLAPIIGPFGFLSYLAYLWWRSGDPWYWFKANTVFWHDTIGSWPELRVLMGGSHPQVSEVGPDRILLMAGLVAGFLILLALMILLLRARLPAAVTSYAISYEFLALLSQALAPRPRFIFTAFPLVMALAFTLRGYTFSIALAASSAVMVFLFFFYTLPFLLGRFPVAP